VESNDILHECQTLARVGGWEYEVGTGQLRWTAETFRIHEVSVEEHSLDVASALSFYAPEHRRRISDAFQRVLNEGGHFAEELYLDTALGNRIWVRCNGQAITEEGKVVRLYGAIQDITDFHSAVTDLEESRRAHAALLNNLPGMAYRCSALQPFGFHFVSEGCLLLTGFNSGELTGKNALTMQRLVHPEDWNGVVGKLRAALAEGVTYESTHRLVRANGDLVWIWERGKVLLESPQSSCLEGFMTDITERKRMEHELLQAQRMHSIGTMAGGVAHDLNNILSPILLNADLLRNDHDPEALEAIRSDAMRGIEIVRQILVFARGSTGHPERVDASATLSSIQHMVRETFPKNIQFEIVKPGEQIEIWVDPTQFYQALLNLCLNARDAMPEGGLLRVTIIIEEPRPGQTRMVQFEVRDSGTGIAEDLMPYIFEPFFVGKDTGSGTGLGLAAVHRIADLHGGSVSCSNHPEGGACFVLTLPSASPMKAPGNGPMPGQQPGPAPAKLKGAGRYVIVVDDEEPICRVVQRVLAHAGFIVETDACAEDAILRIESRELPPDLVITDLMMPGGGGIHLLRYMAEKIPSVPRIAMSGLPDPEIARALPSLGVASFLQKPFSIQGLLEIVAVVVHPAEPA